MAYAQVDVIVEGALDESVFLNSDSAIDTFVSKVERDAEADGLATEVYVLWHQHDEAIDCEGNCVQYLTDHRPTYSFNTEAR